MPAIPHMRVLLTPRRRFVEAHHPSVVLPWQCIAKENAAQQHHTFSLATSDVVPLFPGQNHFGVLAISAAVPGQ
jgi:hypothetical protein